MSRSPVSKCGRCIVLLAMCFVCGSICPAQAFPRFDQWGEAIKSARRMEMHFSSLRESGHHEREVQPFLDRARHRLQALEPHNLELRRYWSEQGRTQAQGDISRGKLHLFYVITPPRTEGPLPYMPPPLDGFEVMLGDRLRMTLVRVRALSWHPHDYVVNYIAVNTRCDGYNEEVERYFRAKHGCDIVSFLWRMAEKEAKAFKHPKPNPWEVWLPFAASGASSCLLVGLVLIRRRRERRTLQQASDANTAVR